jgi:PIN domain nuclease of toxin-antitoxin system
MLCLTRFSTTSALHRDPFDRILIAQSLQHGLTIVTVDDAVRAYALPLLPVA